MSKRFIILISLLIIPLVFVIWYFLFPYFLWEKEITSFFVFTPDYFHSVIAGKGGACDYWQLPLAVLSLAFLWGAYSGFVPHLGAIFVHAYPAPSSSQKSLALLGMDSCPHPSMASVL